MENQNHKLDEIFRQRLHDAEVPPPPFVWPAVEHELQKRRRRLLFVWIFAFGTVLACAWLWQSRLWTSQNPGNTFTPVADLPKNVQEANLPSSKGLSSIIPSRKNVPLKISNRQTEDNIEPIKSLATTNLEMNATEGTISDSPLEINKLESVVSTSNKKESFSPKLFKSQARRKKAQPKFCYDFARHPTAWLLDVYAGPSLAQSSLTSRLDDEPYLNQRLATERRSVAMSAGLRASLMFNGNFLVRTGLHYDQVTEVFEYIDPTYVVTSINTIYVNGQFVGVDTVVSYGENYLKTYNRYGMLDIPLMVGVEMRDGRSGFSINAGISTNVLFQKRGAIIDPITHEPAYFGLNAEKIKNIGPKATLSEDVFRTNVGLSAMASVQWYWHLSPHFRLFIEPSFRQVLRPVSLASHPVEQRYSILGLRLGATRIF